MIDALLHAERLLLHGMLDQAEELYRRTAQQDPRNAIAVVGLARVCLERGDDEGALAHARAALAIDADNAAAIRLDQRLTEVLAGRAGESGGVAPSAALPPTPPAWSSTTPPEPPAPSERVVFERNRSMADHHAADQRQSDSSTEQTAPASGEAVDDHRRGLLDRIFGRNRRS